MCIHVCLCVYVCGRPLCSDPIENFLHTCVCGRGAHSVLKASDYVQWKRVPLALLSGAWVAYLLLHHHLPQEE